MNRNLNACQLMAINLVSAFSVDVLAVEDGDKLLLEIGSLSTNVDTVLQVNGTGGNVGTSIDLEDDLGFETGKQINRFDLLYRFTDKHSLKYSFFQLNRAAIHKINKSIVVRDTEYLVNADVMTGFDYSLHSVSYGYSLRADENSYLDLLAGLYYIDTGFAISEANLGKTESVNGAGPLPLVGLNYERKLAGQWNLGARVTIFKLDVGDYDGTVSDARVRVDYQFTDRFGLGLAYNWQRLNVGVTEANAVGDFDMTMSGAEISAVLRF